MEDLSGEEWSELLAFNELDPFGEQRADIRHAKLMSLLVQLIGGKSVAPEKFMPFPIHDATEEFKPAKPAEVKRRVQSLFGGRARGSKRR